MLYERLLSKPWMRPASLAKTVVTALFVMGLYAYIAAGIMITVAVITGIWPRPG
jgi:hypothetical protein